MLHRFVPLGLVSVAFAGLMSCASAGQPNLAAAPAADGSTPAPAAQSAQTQPSQTQPPPIAVAVIEKLAAPPEFSYAGELTQGGWIRGTVPAGTRRAKLGDQSLAYDKDDRSFFAAFDRDSPDALTLWAELSDGSTYSEEITVAPRKWQIERVNVAKRGGGTSEAWWKKREPEWNAIQGARAKTTGAHGWKQDFAWPVKGRISGRFGRQRIYRGEPGSYHSGIDIAPGNGVPFASPAQGVVVLARTGFSLEGGLIIIDHGNGLNSAFLHASKIAVSEGDEVKQGQYIGNVGASGRATGPHLHWSLKWNDARLDPLLFTGPMS
ncbi:peptidoglycan DD-metalloendopeptidase family protein [Erythrobacter sp. MTPC3]|uniref:peptidoglycan DD-metalloendopeptidase family protein n=1 Tax=Erythrobacter sp. MTPC3 TaxID=3056564 RepID=UPI0036F2E4DB